MACLIAALPAGSATARAVHGEHAHWGLTDHLLARIDDRLAVISWQLAGNKKAPYPKPMVRPGVVDPTVRHGRTGRPRAEVVAYLRRFAPRRQEEVIVDG